ncbi:PREDICTED: glutathione S-transferase T3-like [Fragaria vesca subsp. vesca]|uniref:glutathione S-transferase T3-like n=1 Tax=Fragaria vesca subsp. vesca TaxID=101020 RepID=UPI0002C2FE61|nr:PREDICTED: glutathione S-transferase T3-like [Fragaria vesca subsp. vesca]
MDLTPLNFTNLLNSSKSALDDLNEPLHAYDFPLSQCHLNDSPYEEICRTEFCATEEQQSPCEPSSKKAAAPRQANFSIEEDKLLVSAWLNISLDPVKGTGQKRQQFWKRITKYFEDNKTWTGERSTKSLINRWSTISSSVSKFCGHYSSIEHLRRSGYTEQDKIVEAKETYKKEERHAFVLDHCWVVLRFQQKWMDEHQNQESKRQQQKVRSSKNHDSINLEDDLEAPEPASLKRPIGRKAAKEANKKAKSNDEGSANEKESKIRSELEEFRAKRLESDRIKAEQFKLLLDTQKKEVALKRRNLSFRLGVRRLE